MACATLMHAVFGHIPVDLSILFDAVPVHQP